MNRLRRLWKTQRLTLAGFVLVVALALFFGVRAINSAIYWSSHHEAEPEPWMTVRWIARSWDVPPNLIGEALGPEHMVRRVPLGKIAEARGVDFETISQEVLSAIQEFRAAAPR